MECIAKRRVIQYIHTQILVVAIVSQSIISNSHAHIVEVTLRACPLYPKVWRVGRSLTESALVHVLRQVVNTACRSIDKRRRTARSITLLRGWRSLWLSIYICWIATVIPLLIDHDPFIASIA